MLEYINKSVGSDKKNCVIWLHGLGADGHDFESVIPELDLPIDADIKFIFPHAPVRPITINGGYKMRGWYDISDMGSIENNIDIDGINSSIKDISVMIDQQIESGIKPENIILAGFSQGGAIATYCALFYPKNLGGLIALSTYLPGWSYFKTQVKSPNLSMPVSVAHGLYDPVVPYQAGEHLKLALEALRFNVSFNAYPMEHSLCLEEIHMIRKFLTENFNLNLTTL